MTHGDIVLSSGDASAIPRRRFIPQAAVDGLDAVQGFVGKRNSAAMLVPALKLAWLAEAVNVAFFAFQLATALSTM